MFRGLNVGTRGVRQSRAVRLTFDLADMIIVLNRVKIVKLVKLLVALFYTRYVM